MTDNQMKDYANGLYAFLNKHFPFFPLIEVKIDNSKEPIRFCLN